MARYLCCTHFKIELPLGVTTIGRASECDLPLDDRLVSRQHARIVAAQEFVVVEDLGSRNGVTVNGTRVLGAARLTDGDRVQVGSKQFVFTDPCARAHVGAVEIAESQRGPPDTVRFEALKPSANERSSAGHGDGRTVIPGQRTQ